MLDHLEVEDKWIIDILRFDFLLLVLLCLVSIILFPSFSRLFWRLVSHVVVIIFVVDLFMSSWGRLVLLSPFFHHLLCDWQDDFSPHSPVLGRRDGQSHVVKLVRIGVALNCFGLNAKTRLLLVLEQSLDQLSHDGALLRLNLVILNIELLVLHAHLVELDSELVALLIKLGLLPKVKLLRELGLVLALAQLLLQRDTTVARLELLLVLNLELLAHGLVLFNRVN